MNGWLIDWMIEEGVMGWWSKMNEWMDDLIERNKNINRGYRKLTVWKEAIDLYVYIKSR